MDVLVKKLFSSMYYSEKDAIAQTVGISKTTLRYYNHADIRKLHDG